MSIQVKAVGINLPDGFPQRAYDAVHAKVHSGSRREEQVFHYGGAWNGIAYRFMSCADADDQFTKLIAEPQSHLNRFHQDEALVKFFVSGLSVIETFFYGLYWIGSMAEPGRFPIVTGNHLRGIEAGKTMDRFRAGPHMALFTRSFAALQTQDRATGKWENTAPYAELKEVRNILAHRASYGRVVNMAAGGGVQLDDIWRVRDIPLNDQLTRSRRAWLVATLSGLLDGAEAYVTAAL